MTRHAAVWSVLASLLAVLAVSVPAHAAEEVGAEVRTWDGTVFTVSQVSLDAFYTIVVKPKNGEGLGGDKGAASPPPASDVGGARLFGSVESITKMLSMEPDSFQAHRVVDTVTLGRGAAEIKVPVASIQNLVFARTRVADSDLPPYVAVAHYRYAATAVLTDGSTVQADTVSLGTTRVRGVTAQGRLDIPWDSIESIRFRR